MCCAQVPGPSLDLGRRNALLIGGESVPFVDGKVGKDHPKEPKAERGQPLDWGAHRR
jgi:hypothetical protein